MSEIFDCYVIRRRTPYDSGGRYFCFGGPPAKRFTSLGVGVGPDLFNGRKHAEGARKQLIDRDEWESLTEAEAKARDEADGVS